METLIKDAAPMWDDKFQWICVYIVSVAVLTRVGPYSRANVNSGEFKFNNALWTPVMAVYNLCMTLFSLLCFVGILKVVFLDKPHSSGPDDFTSAPLIKGNDCNVFSRNKLFTNIVYAFYLSKYVEFADTLFLIVKGKEVSWLHFFHHCGAAINMGMLNYSKMEAAVLFVGLNGFIHTLMYFYFGMTQLGVHFKGKSLLTGVQILQFITGLAIFWGYKEIPCFRDNRQLMFTFWFTYAYVGVVFLFFLNFFLQSYIFTSKKSNTKKTTKSE